MQDKHVYCVKCNGEKTVIQRSPAIFRNGSVAVKGKCPSCDTDVYKIVNKEALQIKPDPRRQARYIYTFAAVVLVAGVMLGLTIAKFF
jgi:hypothetical protein